MLKVLNKNKYLYGLNNIDDVYGSRANAIEEIINYHNFKEKIDAHEENLNLSHSETGNSSDISGIDAEENLNISNRSYNSEENSSKMT